VTTTSATPDVAREPADGGPVTLRLSDFPEKEHLAGAGNWLYKIPFRDGHAVLKIYFGSRHPLLHVKKTVGNILVTGRTSHMPRARCRYEVESVKVWEKHGFRCFGMFPEVVFEDLPEGGYMLFEYVPGEHFKTYFRDESIPVEERLATWKRWLPEWHRRHRAAIDHGEPRLIHENGDVKHVMLWEGGFLYFDFEIGFRSRDIRDLVGRELLAYLRSVGKFFGDDMYELMMDAVVSHYPDKSLLLAGWEHAFHNRNRLVRVARSVDFAVKPANRKRYSKYNVALDLKRRLDAASLTGGAA